MAQHRALMEEEMLKTWSGQSFDLAVRYKRRKDQTGSTQYYIMRIRGQEARPTLYWSGPRDIALHHGARRLVLRVVFCSRRESLRSFDHAVSERHTVVVIPIPDVTIPYHPLLMWTSILTTP